MRIRSFHPPTERYDERVKDLDEKMSALVSERHAVSQGNPGFPHSDYLNDWAKKYGTPVQLLQQLFFLLYNRPDFRERVEPEQFLRFVPIMAADQHDEILVMVPYMRQYSNCSVVSVELEGADLDGGAFHHLEIKLTIEGYESMRGNGQSSGTHASHNFIVTPPIPDDEVPRLKMNVEYESRPFQHQDQARHPIPPTTVRLSAADLKGPR